MDNPVVLFYDPGQAAFASKLPALCAVRKIRLRPVGPGLLDRTLAELSATGASLAPAAGAQPLPEPLLVFCGLSSAQLDWMLVGLRKQKAFCLKAVLTPSNGSWTLRQLYGELVRERAKLGG